MSHFVVILDSAYDYEQFNHVLAVKHTFEEAKEVFAANVEEEKAYAEKNGFTVYEDEDYMFEAGRDGEWCVYHTNLYIEEVKE